MKYANEFINMPPVFRNKIINTADRNIIGDVNYEQIKMVGGPKRGNERKLTCLLDTCGEFVTFSNYYLFFLIDYCHLVIDEFADVCVFTKTDCFNKFVTTFMTRRIAAMGAGNKGKKKYCKMVLNSSYGYDIKNNENYSKVKLCTLEQSKRAHAQSNHLATRKINDDLYMVSCKPSVFKCDTCIQCGYATLDNAKFAYLMFYYTFITKCMDMSKIHAIEGDTDSLYFAIVGHPNAGPNQGFRHVILNRGFYHQHVYEWFPDPYHGIANEKKLGGLAIENIGDYMIAIAPKNYTIGIKTDANKAKRKMKGCSEGRNKQITSQSYIDNINKKTVTNAENCGFRVKNGVVVKYTVNKAAITGIHTKMIVLPNESCAPYIHGLTAADYRVTNYGVEQALTADRNLKVELRED